MPSKSIPIRHDAALRDIKEAFRAVYPYLKLEFFQRAHRDGGGSPRREMYTDKLRVRDIRDTQEEGAIELHDEMSVAQLEAEFEARFDLYVQVFRKSGRLWLETSVTDHWSLHQQNQHGAEAEESPENEDILSYPSS
jgi:hypothetical protein